MAQGTALLDFGTGATDTSLAVSAPSITAGQLVEAWVFPAATTNNTADNHWVEDLVVLAGAPTAGVGFVIYARCDEGMAYGVYNVAWVYN